MKIIKSVFVACAILALTSCVSNAQKPVQESFPVQKTDEEWKDQLTPNQYYVLRQAGTERPFSSPLNDNKKEGVYICAACEIPLFKSDHKFNSGTGWPSFDREIEGAVGYSTDYKVGYARTEEHCSNCGGHLGHVFSDGPRDTTGRRHCINGDALIFIPAEEKENE